MSDPTFGAVAISRLTGVSPKTLHFWDQAGLVSPSLRPSSGIGSRRLYSFADLVIIKAVRCLREAGLPADDAAAVAIFLRDQPLVIPLSSLFLITNRRAVFLLHPSDLLTRLDECPPVAWHVLDLGRLVQGLREAIEAEDTQPSPEALP